MKKSNKTKINEKDLMKDTTKIMKIISDLEKANLETIDLKKFEEEVNKVIAEITSLDADAKAKILMEIREKLVQENKVKESEPKTD